MAFQVLINPLKTVKTIYDFLDYLNNLIQNLCFGIITTKNTFLELVQKKLRKKSM